VGRCRVASSSCCGHFGRLLSLQGYQDKAPLTRDGTPNLEHRGKSESTVAGNDLRNYNDAHSQ